MNSRKRSYMPGLLAIVVSVFACLLVEVATNPAEEFEALDDTVALADI